MSTVNLVSICGSTRQDSFNRRVLKVASAGATAAGAKVNEIDLRELALPLYDQDLEDAHGLPDGVLKLKQLMLESDGFLVACPEYNGSFSAVFKNAIDWASRPAAGEAILGCFSNKVISLMSASPGAMGGIRSLTQVRTLLAGVGAIVLPKQIAVGKAGEAFNADGSFVSEKRQAAITSLGTNTVQFIQRIKG